jgi:hypothetical protein
VPRSHEATFPSNYNASPRVLAFATRFQAVSATFPVGPPAPREAFGVGHAPQGTARLVVERPGCSSGR